MSSGPTKGGHPFPETFSTRVTLSGDMRTTAFCKHCRCDIKLHPSKDRWIHVSGWATCALHAKYALKRDLVYDVAHGGLVATPDESYTVSLILSRYEDNDM